MSILLEICAASAEDCVIAEQNGAGRVELNAALALGGLTPSIGTLRVVKQACSLPVIVMIRPKDGGFTYSDKAFQIMRGDIKAARDAGADGFAFGILKPDRTIDKERCAVLLESMQGRESVFHRAFDLTPDPFEALEQCIRLGFTRILTSGQKPSAPEGSVLIKKLIEQAAGRIEILPGGGISAENCVPLIRQTGCNQIHGSFSEIKTEDEPEKTEIRFRTRKMIPENAVLQASPEKVRRVMNLINQTGSI